MVECVERWAQALEELHGRIAPRFARSEQRQRSLAYLKALLCPVERKNGWQLAEQMGQGSPDGVQRLLNAAQWSADEVRDELQRYVIEHLGESEGVLIVDETGFLKQGTKSVGVKRQYSGTAGRVANCQIGVFLAYAGSRGATLLDRALYLPREWVEDEKRCQAAGVPEQTDFATKPALAQAMIERALEAGVPCGWVTGDSIYGSDRKLRVYLEHRQQPFVLALAANEPLMWQGARCREARQIGLLVEPQQWQRLCVAEGAKGPRLHEWAWTPLWRLQLSAQEHAQGHWLLMRRSIDDPDEVTYYVVFAPRAGTTLEQVAKVAGMRWHIESCFAAAKSQCGLDQYEVRTWNAWHRHITLALWSLAFLTVMRLHEGQKGEEAQFPQKGAVAVS